MKLTYTNNKTSIEVQDSMFVNLLSTANRNELKAMTAGLCRGNAKTVELRACVAAAIATGHYILSN